MKLKILSITICFLTAIASHACAAEKTFERSTFAGAGYLKIGSAESAVFVIGNDLEYGDFSLSFDIIGIAGEKKPAEIDTIILRDLEYDTGTFGIAYSELKDVTFGQGLLVSNYSPWSRGPSLLSNKGVGLRSYYDGDIYSIDSFGTWSHVYGVRLEQDFFPFFILGETFATDADGFDLKQSSGTTKNIKKMTGYGADLRTEIFEDTNFYVEAAKLEEYGSAYSLGIIFERDRIFLNTLFSVERRFIDPNFIPGYFGPFYESAPIDISLVEADKRGKDGYLVKFDTMVLGFVDFNLILETYDLGRPAFGGDLRLWAIRDLYLRILYREPSYSGFRVEDFENSKIVGGSITYDVTSSVTIGTHYKKSFNPALGEVDESSFGEVKYYF